MSLLTAVPETPLSHQLHSPQVIQDRMGLGVRLPAGSHAQNSAEDDEEPPPLNPLAPKPRASPSNASAGSRSRPASFTPLQLGGINSPSSSSIADSDPSRDGSTSSGIDPVQEVRAEMLANWLHTEQEKRVWTFGEAGEGVFTKRAKGSYACAPHGVQNDGTGLYQAVTELNVRVSNHVPPLAGW